MELYLQVFKLDARNDPVNVPFDGNPPFRQKTIADRLRQARFLDTHPNYGEQLLKVYVRAKTGSVPDFSFWHKVFTLHRDYTITPSHVDNWPGKV